MEFETNTPQPSTGITDDQRLAAQSRVKTLTPLDPFLTPAPVAPVIVTEEQANVSVDSENTAEQDSLLQPSQTPVETPSQQGSTNKSVVISTAIIVATLIAGTALLFVS